MHRGITCALAALVVFASACSSGDAAPNTDPSPSDTASSSPTPTEEPTSESPTPTASDTTAGDDLSQVPDEITVEYLDRVMASVNQQYAVAFQLARDIGSATDPSVVEELSHVYETGYAVGELDSFEQALGTDALADPVGVPTSAVLSIVVADEECVLFTVEHQLAPLFADPGAFEQRNPLYVKLEQAETTTSAPLPWRVHYAAPDPDPAPTTCEEAGPRLTEDGS